MAKQPAKDKNTRITETFNKETTTRIKSHSPITDTSSEQHNITSLTAELALESPRISVGSHPARRVSIIAANGSRRRSVASTASINSAVEESSASEDCFALEEFSSRPWVQEALNNPWHPNSVLSFFYGHQLRRSEILQRIAATCKGFRKDEYGYKTRRWELSQPVSAVRPCHSCCGKENTCFLSKLWLVLCRRYGGTNCPMQSFSKDLFSWNTRGICVQRCERVVISGATRAGCEFVKG